MDQASPERRTRGGVAAKVANHNADARASRLAHENHQRFAERSLRNSAEAHGRLMAAQRRADTNHRGGRGGSGVIGTTVGLAIIGLVAFGLYSFVVSSGLLT